jgi:hypothetical protein
MNPTITFCVAMSTLFALGCATTHSGKAAPCVYSFTISGNTCRVLEAVSKEFPKARNLDGNLTDFFMIFDPPVSNFEYAQEFFYKRNWSLYFANFNSLTCELTIRGEVDYVREILEIVSSFERDPKLAGTDFQFSFPRSIEYNQMCRRLGLRPRVKMD